MRTTQTERDHWRPVIKKFVKEAKALNKTQALQGYINARIDELNEDVNCNDLSDKEFSNSVDEFCECVQLAHMMGGLFKGSQEIEKQFTEVMNEKKA